MSCNTRRGPAAIIRYIDRKTGYEITSSDWHELTRKAERAGFEVSRTRVPIEDAEGSVKGLAEALGPPTSSDEEDMINGTWIPKGGGPDEAGLIDSTLGEEGRLTQNHLAVLNYLLSEEEGPDGEALTPADKVAEVIAKRSIRKAAESDDYRLNLYAARNFPKEEMVMDFDGPKSVQETLLENEDVRVRFATAKNPNLNGDLIESLGETSDDVSGVLNGLVQNPKLREYGDYSTVGPLASMIANGHGTLAAGSKYLNSDLQQELAEEGDISALESLTRAIPDRQPARWLTRDEIIESGARDPWYEYNFMRLETERVILDRVNSEEDPWRTDTPDAKFPPGGKMSSELRHVAENLARYSPREETLAVLAEPYGVEAEGAKSGTPIAEDYYQTVEYVVNNGFTSRETLEKIRDNTVWEYPSHIRERAREALETPDYKRVSDWEKAKRLA